MKPEGSTIAIVGDVHGHLQLALCVIAQWQKELNVSLDAVFLCGDVGTFTDDSQLDNATRAHAKRNPIELEFLTQWSTTPQAPWLDSIFNSEDEGALGLSCPVVMIHGNHEGFDHLAAIAPPLAPIPNHAIEIEDLPSVDTNGHIRFLPSGWRIALPSGHIVGGVGGIEEGRRRAAYHSMAYLNDRAILHLAESEGLDVLLTHQGPAGVQGSFAGSTALDLLLDAETARTWFHGHSVANSDIVHRGPNGNTIVVPLADIAFPGKGDATGDPGVTGWAIATLCGDHVAVERQDPACLRTFRLHKWRRTDQGLYISPSLKQIADKMRFSQ